LPENLERCANYPIVRVCQTEVLFLKKEIMLLILCSAKWRSNRGTNSFVWKW
jgi:hypothetical protein